MRWADSQDRPAPDDFVPARRPQGQLLCEHVPKTGAQFLLVLKKNKVMQSTASSSEADYTVNWYALGPVNEQLRSDADPCLLWIRDQLAKSESDIR